MEINGFLSVSELREQCKSHAIVGGAISLACHKDWKQGETASLALSIDIFSPFMYPVWLFLAE